MLASGGERGGRRGWGGVAVVAEEASLKHGRVLVLREHPLACLLRLAGHYDLLPPHPTPTHPRSLLAMCSP
eukprot:129930-Chlamydomonas_euryale.AAC.1